jgi:hypothetical protein
MAVVVGNYIRRGKQGNPRAKDAVRYMAFQPQWAENLREGGQMYIRRMKTGT